MNDDELGEFLRGEIPEPGPGYWDEFDSRIAAIDHDRVRNAHVEERDGDDTHTDAEVIRLTDMNNSRTPRTIPGASWRLLSAAAAVLFVIGIAFGLGRGDGAEDTRTASPDRTPGESESTAPPEPTATSDPDTPTPTSGVESADSETPGVWLLNGTDEIQARAEPGADAEVVADYLPGLEALLSTGRRAQVDGIDWIEIDASHEVPNQWLPADRLERIGEVLEPVEPSLVRVTGDGPVNVRRWPGTDADLQGTTQPGDTLPATGRRVSVDGLEWAEIDAGEERPISWIAAEFVEFVDDEGLDTGAESVVPIPSCYRDDDDNFLVITSDTTDDTFVGILEYFEIVEVASGTNTGGSTYAVSVASLGTAEGQDPTIQRVEEWVGVPEGIEIGDRAALPAVDCSVFPDRVESMLARADGRYPTLPDLRECATDGESVLVMDFDARARTFTGALAYLDSVEAVAGVRSESQSEIFAVNTSPIGSAEEAGEPSLVEEEWRSTVEEEWRSTEEGISVGDRALLEPVDCAEVAETVATLDGLVNDHPAHPE